MLVTPMRSGGVELLAGVTVDPTFGPVLAVGLGGVWVEILKDTSLRAAPGRRRRGPADAGELRGLPLLRGARGSRAGRPGRASPPPSPAIGDDGPVAGRGAAARWKSTRCG